MTPCRWCQLYGLFVLLLCLQTTAGSDKLSKKQAEDVRTAWAAVFEGKPSRSSRTSSTKLECGSTLDSAAGNVATPLGNSASAGRNDLSAHELDRSAHPDWLNSSTEGSGTQDSITRSIRSTDSATRDTHYTASSPMHATMYAAHGMGHSTTILAGHAKIRKVSSTRGSAIQDANIIRRMHAQAASFSRHHHTSAASRQLSTDSSTGLSKYASTDPSMDLSSTSWDTPTPSSAKDENSLEAVLEVSEGLSADTGPISSTTRSAQQAGTANQTGILGHALPSSAQTENMETVLGHAANLANSLHATSARPPTVAAPSLQEAAPSGKAHAEDFISQQAAPSGEAHAEDANSQQAALSPEAHVEDADSVVVLLDQASSLSDPAGHSFIATPSQQAALSREAHAKDANSIKVVLHQAASLSDSPGHSSVTTTQHSGSILDAARSRHAGSTSRSQNLGPRTRTQDQDQNLFHSHDHTGNSYQKLGDGAGRMGAQAMGAGAMGDAKNKLDLQLHPLHLVRGNNRFQSDWCSGPHCTPSSPLCHELYTTQQWKKRWLRTDGMPKQCQDGRATCTFVDLAVAVVTPHTFGDEFADSDHVCHDYDDGVTIRCKLRRAKHGDELSRAADAQWFHIPSLSKDFSQIKKLHPRQVLIGASMESSTSYPLLSDISFMSKFDIEASYRLCSPAHMTHNYFHMSNLDRLFRSPMPFHKKKTAVAYLSDNCHANSHRDEIIRQLIAINSTHVPVDVLGCRANRANVAKDKLELLSKYKFCVTMEDSVAKDYMTEKTWQALEAGCLPITLGPPNIKQFLPMPNAVLDYINYGSALRLHEELVHLANNATAYEEKLGWKYRCIEDLSLSFWRTLRYNSKGSSACNLCVAVNRSKNKRKRFAPCIRNKKWKARHGPF